MGGPGIWVAALFLLGAAVVGASIRGGAFAAVLVAGVAGACGLASPFVPVLPLVLAAVGLLNLVCWSPPSWMRGRLDGMSTSWLGHGLVTVLLGAVIPFGLSELAERAGAERGFWKTPRPMETVLAPGTEDWRVAHITADPLREPDPVLWWRPADCWPYNRQRFKGPEAAVPKPESTFRIMAYGDSNTDGPDRGGWPERLQQRLERKRAGRFEVLNAGVAGYSSHQGLLRFQQEADAYRPDLILVSFGWNDLPPAVGAPDDFFAAPGRLQVAVQRLLLHYHAYLWFRQLLRVRAPASRTGEPRVSPREYRRNLMRFSEEGARRGVRVVLLTRPHRAPVAELEARSDWRSRVPAYNRMVLAVAAETGTPVVDAAAFFQSLSPTYFYDDCHFTAEGNEAMARLLLAQLKKQGLLPLADAAD